MPSGAAIAVQLLGVAEARRHQHAAVGQPVEQGRAARLRGSAPAARRARASGGGMPSNTRLPLSRCSGAFAAGAAAAAASSTRAIPAASAGRRRDALRGWVVCLNVIVRVYSLSLGPSHQLRAQALHQFEPSMNYAALIRTDSGPARRIGRSHARCALQQSDRARVPLPQSWRLRRRCWTGGA